MKQVLKLKELKKYLFGIGNSSFFILFILICCSCNEKKSIDSIADEMIQAYCECYKSELKLLSIADRMQIESKCHIIVLDKFDELLPEYKSENGNYSQAEMKILADRLSNGYINDCLIAKNDIVTRFLVKTKVEIGIKAQAELLIGTSFNLDPILECFMDTLVYNMTYNESLLHESRKLKEKFERVMMKDLKGDMESCAFQNMDDIGTDRLLNINREFFMEAGMQFEIRNHASDASAEKYLVCLFEGTNGKETSIDFIKGLQGSDNSVKKIEEECFEYSKR